MATKPKLDADLSGEPVDQTDYRSKIGSLMYLTSSRPDIVQARTKKPKVVPISTRKPKSQANKSVVTPLKKIVASESTTQKSKSYYRMLYEKTRSNLSSIPSSFNTVVLRLSVSYSNLVQSRAALPYQAHPYSISFHQGTALPEDRFQYLVRRIGMRCLTPAELEVASGLIEWASATVKPCQEDSYEISIVHMTVFILINGEPVVVSYSAKVEIHYSMLMAQTTRLSISIKIQIKKSQDLNEKTSENSDIKFFLQDIKFIKTLIVKGDY
ncbi:hypothetical protein Tco_0538228 [Tanacetum coccineum]